MLFLMALFILMFISSYAFTYEEKQKAIENLNKCLDEIASIVESTEKKQCLIRCVFEKEGLLDSAGQIIEATVKERVSKGNDTVKVRKAIYALDVCKHFKGKSLCETVYKFYVCFEQSTR